MRPLASRHMFRPSGAPRGRSYLMMYNGGSNGTNYWIGAAESFDPNGATWTKLTPSAPLISPGPAAWENTGVKDPWVVKVAPGDYRMWYSGFNGSTVFQIGYATSPDGLTWTKYPGNPVLTFSGSGWDEAIVVQPVVLYEPSDGAAPFKMWYAGAATGTLSTLSIGYAHSTDGINWTKYASNPVVSPGAGGSYDAIAALPAAIVKSGSTYNLFYDGRPNATNPSGDQPCVATFTSPTGTYTKSGSNPLLSPSTAEQALTSNLTVGSATVNVAATAAFHAGEPCLLHDSTTAQADVVVQSIGSGTQMTLAQTVPYAWTTANTATIRSAYFNSVDGRSVLPTTSGGWEMYLAPFQQFGAGILCERQAAASSSSLSSGWAFDYTRGFLLPLGAIWDTLSCENPCVIAE